MSRRQGFTLVELLVVAGIFVMLFGMVLTMSRPNQASAMRRGAAGLASVLVATQSNALGNPVGAGVILDPFVTETGTTPMVTTASAADMLPFITGLCTGVPPQNRNVTWTTGTLSPHNADPATDLNNAYKIQFWRDLGQPMSPWFGVQMSGTVGVIRFRAADGQASQNTIWPDFGPGAAPNVLIARYPNEGETLLDLPKNVAIDLRFSGVGDGTSAWNGLAGKSAIGITYDSLGGVDAVMQSLGSGSATAIHPLEPVYLLVNSVDWINQSISLPAQYPPLGNQHALWVVLHPQTGRVSVSSNVVRTGTDASAVRAARANARAQVAVGR